MTKPSRACASAVELKPDFAQAHRALGVELSGLEESRCGGGRVIAGFGHRARIRRDSLRTGDDSSAHGKASEALPLLMPGARACADVGDESSLCQLRRAHGIYGQRLTSSAQHSKPPSPNHGEYRSSFVARHSVSSCSTRGLLIAYARH